MGAIQLRIEPDARNPFRNKAGVLTCRHALAEAPAAWYKGIDAIELPHPAGAAGRVALALANVDAVPELLQRARQVAGGLPEFSIRTPNLSDAFMTLTGHSLREGEPD